MESNLNDWTLSYAGYGAQTVNHPIKWITPNDVREAQEVEEPKETDIDSFDIDGSWLEEMGNDIPDSRDIMSIDLKETIRDYIKTDRRWVVDAALEPLKQLMDDSRARNEDNQMRMGLKIEVYDDNTYYELTLKPNSIGISYDEKVLSELEFKLISEVFYNCIRLKPIYAD